MHNFYGTLLIYILIKPAVYSDKLKRVILYKSTCVRENDAKIDLEDWLATNPHMADIVHASWQSDPVNID